MLDHSAVVQVNTIWLHSSHSIHLIITSTVHVDNMLELTAEGRRHSRACLLKKKKKKDGDLLTPCGESWELHPACDATYTTYDMRVKKQPEVVTQGKKTNKLCTSSTTAEQRSQISQLAF